MLMVPHKRMTIADNCVGCYACEAACKQEHNLPVGPRWIRVYPDMRETGGRWYFNYMVTECEHAGPAPCQVACPAGLDVWHYVILVSQGNFGKALEVIRETTPFAGVLGRVCPHPCEIDCERRTVDSEQPVSIRHLKRFVADYEREAGRKKAKAVRKTKDSRVAIVGSGPAGLNCAYTLVKQGYPVTVFEAAPEAGGLLRYALPKYRLPDEILDDEIHYIEELGVEIKTGTSIKDTKTLFNQGYQAVFLAVGATRSLRLGVEGEDNTTGVMTALELLKQAKSAAKPIIGSRVIVIGGGNSAMDAARVSLRLGAKEVHMVCLESRDLTSKDGMLADAIEIEEAEEEGLIIDTCLGVKKVLSQNGRFTGIESIPCISVREKDGSFAPKYAEHPVRTMEGDTLVVAIGQRADVPGFEEVERTSAGTFRADIFSLATNVPGVFAGGDVVSGPLDVASAIGASNEAAISIDRYLRGLDLVEGRLPIAKRVRQILPTKIVKTVRSPVPLLDAQQRVKSFAEVELGFDERLAIEEAKRCFNCGECGAALEKGLTTACVHACPSHCIYHPTPKIALKVYREDFPHLWNITPKIGTYRED
ncbi:MAG TPA: FAD-dependent oxidoreductase [Dehalococcoidia bacterium]|nr:FAD-dependent oxidoreductase [Dehalococcoidia bacterium]